MPPCSAARLDQFKRTVQADQAFDLATPAPSTLIDYMHRYREMCDDIDRLFRAALASRDLRRLPWVFERRIGAAQEYVLVTRQFRKPTRAVCVLHR